MIAEILPGIPLATSCEANHTHTPKPLRFVWHHVLPRTCGGQTVLTNLAHVCDNCHYGIHAILWELAQNEGVTTKFKHMEGTGRYTIAMRGYQAAVSAGTVAQIPNEGSD